jgi:Domain of unknown function (DUF4936)
VTVTSYFIYYRVAPGREPLAGEQVRRLQATLAAATGVRCRLMTKRGEPNLWMEVYEAVSDSAAFEQALDNAVQELQLVQLLAPGSLRHVECFEG